MKKLFIQKLQGLNTDLPERRLPNQRLSDCDNVYFEDMFIKKRWGIDAFPTGSFSSAIMGIYYYETAISGMKEIIVFTTTHGYYYDDTTGSFNIINRKYVKGTVEVSGTSVTGTDTEWQTSWSSSYVSMKIGFETTDPDSVTTWYDIESINSTTDITLSSDGGTISSGASYVLLFCFSGDEDNSFSFEDPYDEKFDDKVVAISNGIEPIMIYYGSGNSMKEIGEQDCTTTSSSSTLTVTDSGGMFSGMSVSGPGIPASTLIDSVTSSTEVELTDNATASLTDYPLVFGTRRPAKYLGYFGSVGYEHFISGWIADAIDEPQRLEVSAAGKYPEKFLNDITGDYGTYYLLFDSPDEIVGIKQLQNRIIIYKENSITEMMAKPQGTNADPYNFNQNKIIDVAPISNNVVINYGRFHIFMGWDNFYIFDGINTKPIGDEVINSVIRNMNETYIKRAFAIPIREERLYVIFIPTGDNQLPSQCYAYNYTTGVWTKWTFLDSSGDAIYFTSWGRWRKSYSPTWAEIETAGTTWAAMDMRWEDLIIYENIDRYLLG
ncbi:MAG TPA: hypothetical protein VJ951_05755, partial [Bacteroidales bacterium]|nr:hypothetical protein [Bacteroidales bacterium]